MRLYAEFGFVALGDGVLPDHRRHRSQRRRDFRALQFLRPVLPERCSDCRFGWSILGTLAVGAALGGINGLLIGYLKARPFLTTLVTLIILRASVNHPEREISPPSSRPIRSTAMPGTSSARAMPLGVPDQCRDLVVVLIVGHIFLSRSRYGWHLTAIGASRKAARHAGIRGRAHAVLQPMRCRACCARSAVCSMPRGRAAPIRRPASAGNSRR